MTINLKSLRSLFLLWGLLLLSGPSLFATNVIDTISHLDWDGVEVRWVEDQRLPVYTIAIYFADGAISDASNRKGETSTMFDLLESGTRRYSQQEISDHLDFYAAARSGNVNHEYASYTVSGLIKDLVPTMKKVCHLFADSIFPKHEVKKVIKKQVANLRSMINSKGALANRAFRQLSLKGSPFDYPAEGKIGDLPRINQRGLKKRLDYFNRSVKKRIYLFGPKKVLAFKDIVKHDCRWKGEGANFVRQIDYSPVKASGKGAPIYLITVPDANQAQVRVGRFLNRNQDANRPLMSLASGFLGGGFTSKLNREVRVKRGLTYSISSFASMQKEYGRAAIMTSTRNDRVVELLQVVRDVIKQVGQGEYPAEEFLKAQGHLAGGNAFRFEQGEGLVSQLLFFDHVGTPYRHLVEFPAKVEGLNAQQMNQTIKDLFAWSKQTIVVLGSAALRKELKKLGNVKVIPYKRFL
ncbi:MAG: insulinase family protein [Bdellovibrionales bacterium]|jgi:zinc protease|nr:insulinase family protein [Bdellovibrionales bacterium]MBT3527251.1 insulinase family protein [Bdellovibrionales bacterium]MBT7668402.1 insulinase family protein [Bdellovibrionales bacterium]MBT7767892.1 insulinase family protein [Bdellovibrionales bacterium]